MVAALGFGVRLLRSIAALGSGAQSVSRPRLPSRLHMAPSSCRPCWSGFSWDRKYFPHPAAWLAATKARGVHSGLNLHFQSGLVRGEDGWEAFREATGLPSDAAFARFDPLNRTYSAAFHEHVLAPLERQGVDFWCRVDT